MAKDKTKTRNTANRLSRADKIAKRLKNISAKTSFKAKSAVFTFTVFARQAVELGGFLVGESNDAVLLRHKRTSASQKTVVSRFGRADLIEVFGAVGEVSSVTTFREVAIREVIGRLVEDKGGVMTVQTVSGETVKLYQHDGIRIEVRADDEASAGGSEGGKKSKKKGKAEKEGKKSKKGDKKSKKSKKDEDDDDDLDD